MNLMQNVGLWNLRLLTDYPNTLGTSLHLQAIFPGRVRDQQVASFVESIEVLTQNKGGDVGNPSKWAKCGSAPTGKSQGSEVGGQDPRPQISSLVGNQACIVPRLL